MNLLIIFYFSNFKIPKAWPQSKERSRHFLHQFIGILLITNGSALIFAVFWHYFWSACHQVVSFSKNPNPKVNCFRTTQWMVWHLNLSTCGQGALVSQHHNGTGDHFSLIKPFMSSIKSFMKISKNVSWPSSINEAESVS